MILLVEMNLSDAMAPNEDLQVLNKIKRSEKTNI